MMLVFGLTGGIASGKSTVAQMLRQRGVSVVDADEIAREIVAPGSEGLAAVAARFPLAVRPDGQLDRARLGEIVFSDSAERAALNAITHPRIAQRVIEKTQALAAQGERFAVYDAPLLIENRLHESLAGVILVVVPEAIQLERLRARNGLSEADARSRLAAQMPLEAKRPFATWVIDNAGSRDETAKQVDQVLEHLKQHPHPR